MSVARSWDMFLGVLSTKVFKTVIERSMLISEKAENAINKSFVERVIFETIVQYKPSHKTMLSAPCSNLSVGGLYLRTQFPFNIDDTLILSFSLPFQEQEISISCHARIAWTNFDLNRRKLGYISGVGLQFLNLSHEDLSTLAKFIDAYDEEKRMNVVCAWCGNCLGMRKGPLGTTSHGICNQCRENLNM